MIYLHIYEHKNIKSTKIKSNNKFKSQLFHNNLKKILILKW